MAIIITGNVIRDNTHPPTIGADRGIPKKLINNASPNSPKTIEGTAARLLMLTSIKSVSLFFGAKLSK